MSIKNGEKYYFIEVYKGARVHVQSAEWESDEYFDFPARRSGNFFPGTPEGKRDCETNKGNF